MDNNITTEPHTMKPKRAKRSAAARRMHVPTEQQAPWKPSREDEAREWAEQEAKDAERIREEKKADEAVSRDRVEARARRIALLRAEAEKVGKTEEMFPTAAAPYEFGSIRGAYPITLVTPTTPATIEEAPVQEGELATLAHEINTRLTLADRLDTVSSDHRLTAAIRLAQAKKICEAKAMSFRKWAEAHIPHAFVTIRNLARVGSAEDPKLALEMFRTKNAEANRELRARKKAEVQALIAANPEVAEEIAQGRPAVEMLREGGRFTGAVSLSPVEVMLREFDRLEAEAKAEFLKRAAEHMGALVEIP